MEDSYGNHVTTGTGSADQVSISGATCAASSVTAVAGVATSTCTLSTMAGTYPLTATDATHGGYAHAIATITVNPASAAQLAFSSPPGSITAGTTITTLVVWVEDSYGNHVTTGTGSADQVSISGATCAASSVTAVAGVATFHTCTLSTMAGTYPVTATDATHGGYAHAIATITVNPASAAQLAFSSPPGSITAGTTITTLVVWVEDSYGNHVTTGTGSADQVSISGATCAASSVTAVAGVATFHTCTLSTMAGTYPVTATDATHGGYTHAIATITVNPASAAQLAFSSPPGSITAGTTITTLVVWVEDSYGNHVTTGTGSADQVSISGATSAASSVTAVAGVATFHTCTLSTMAGNYPVTATDATHGGYTHASTTVTVNPASAAQLAFSSPPGSITAGTTITTLVVWVEDSYGNHVTTGTGSADQVSISGATCAASSVTAVAGVATFHTCTLSTTAGNYTVTATDATHGGYTHAVTTISIDPAVAAKLVFLGAPASITSGTAIPTLLVEVEDSYGNLVATGTGAIDDILVSGATCTTASVNAVGGVATFHSCSLPTTTGPYTVTATDTTHTDVTHATTTITVLPATAAELVFSTPPASISAGAIIASLVVWVEDTYGNVVATGTGSGDVITISVATCTAASLEAVAGIATFRTCNLPTTAGNHSVNASDATHIGVTHATTTITVLPAAAAQLAFRTPPASLHRRVHRHHARRLGGGCLWQPRHQRDRVGRPGLDLGGRLRDTLGQCGGRGGHIPLLHPVDDRRAPYRHSSRHNPQLIRPGLDHHHCPPSSGRHAGLPHTHGQHHCRVHYQLVGRLGGGQLRQPCDQRDGLR